MNISPTFRNICKLHHHTDRKWARRTKEKAHIYIYIYIWFKMFFLNYIGCLACQHFEIIYIKKSNQLSSISFLVTTLKNNTHLRNFRRHKFTVCTHSWSNYISDFVLYESKLCLTWMCERILSLSIYILF